MYFEISHKTGKRKERKKGKKKKREKNEKEILAMANLYVDIGLRNLDIHFGMERRVVFDFINVINDEASLKQALIKDKTNPNLFMLAASQTRDKSALKMEGVEKILEELRRDFDYIVCDSPAGIESGAHHAMYWSDEAIICTNPETSSVRDSDKMIGIIQSKSKRAIEGKDVKLHLLITRYSAERAETGGMLPVRDIVDMLGVKLVGVIPESPHVLESTNVGKPVITKGPKSDASQAYTDMVDRFLGSDLPMNFITPKQKSFFQNLMSKISQ
eukprot:Phypoly_transcript_11221.p1 GENE.Phypoly_transcript_11221~~Phypoly_transcript_11221.p1  ORF type:complete len:272 (+),score=52.75 Phypoly_transcript_11221:408-1223(+)